MPTWGPVIGFPKPASGTDSKYIDPGTWTLGAHGDTVYASWLDQNDLWDTKDHLRVMKSTDRGTTWGPALDMSGPMELDGAAEDANEMQVFTFVGDAVYTLSFERIDADNRKLVVRKAGTAVRRLRRAALSPPPRGHRHFRTCSARKWWSTARTSTFW